MNDERQRRAHAPVYLQPNSTERMYNHVTLMVAGTLMVGIILRGMGNQIVIRLGVNMSKIEHASPNKLFILSVVTGFWLSVGVWVWRVGSAGVLGVCARRVDSGKEENTQKMQKRLEMQ